MFQLEIANACLHLARCLIETLPYIIQSDLSLAVKDCQNKAAAGLRQLCFVFVCQAMH